MRKISLISIVLLIVSIPTFAGGYLTNTNQHPAFLRMLSRGATTEIDGALSNPAGLAFLPKDGFFAAVSIQSAFQERNVDATFGTWERFDKNNPANSKPADAPYQKYYKGRAAAPVIPSAFFAWKSDKWVLSSFFAVTGGGGKASFDDGLPMFESLAMASIIQKTGIVAPDWYDLNCAMNGKQYIYSLQMGITHKVNDWLSVFAGGRMNYFTGGYDGYLNVKMKDAAAEKFKQIMQSQGATPEMAQGAVDQINNSGLELDCKQTGWGLTPVVGVDVKLGNFNFGAKYEFKTNLNIENDTEKNSDPEGALKDFAHGVNTPSDIPGMLSLAAAYQFIPSLRASVEYHWYDDKNAGMAGGKQKFLTKGTNEYLAGIEWDATKYLTLSCGGQITDYGLSDNFQSDTSFSCDSYSLGVGAKINVTDRAIVNVGYMWTNYSDYTKKSDNYNGTGLPGTNVYSRANKVFGLSLEYQF